MSEFHRQVAEAARAVEILSPISFAWLGKPSDPPSLAVRKVLNPETQRDLLVFLLQTRLYEGFYCRGTAMPKGLDRIGGRVPAHTTYSNSILSEANQGKGFLQSGWTVKEKRGNRLLVQQKSGLVINVLKKDCKAEEKTFKAGNSIAIHFPKELLAISPTYYMAMSDKELSESDNTPKVRIYWNVGPDFAAALVRNVTFHLNAKKIPFRLKVVSDPVLFARRDSAVLLVRKSDYSQVIFEMTDFICEMEKDLRPGTPPFTLKIANGISVAEDPGFHDSFGFHRCGILASALVTCHENRVRSLTDRIIMVEACFTKAKLNLERPYLEPGSDDIYASIIPEKLKRNSTHRLSDESEGVSYLEVARRIGSQLSANAIWFENRCNWVSPFDELDVNGMPKYVLRSLDGDLYGGTSGIALFFAALGRITGDSLFADLAMGAIRQASAEQRFTENTIGLFSGLLGVAFAASRIGNLLGNEEAIDLADTLLDRVKGKLSGTNEFDIASGSAGAILGLLEIARVHPDKTSLVELASRFGELLVAGSEVSSMGTSWPSAIFRRKFNLLGYLHGVSGIAHALLELHAVTGQNELCEIAKSAFSYEQNFFNRDHSNWPDLREVRHRRTAASVFLTHWCHGAPGIALSRARAYQISRDKDTYYEAQTALETTSKMIEASLADGTGQFCLCHGIIGNAEILAEASSCLEGASNAWATARRVADFGIARYIKRRQAWPSGVSSGEAPGLMLGLAGVGYFYLRLVDDSLPSILFISGSSLSKVFDYT